MSNQALFKKNPENQSVKQLFQTSSLSFEENSALAQAIDELFKKAFKQQEYDIPSRFKLYQLIKKHRSEAWSKK